MIREALTLLLLLTMFSIGLGMVMVILWFLVLPQRLHWTTERPDRDGHDVRERHYQTPVRLTVDATALADWAERAWMMIRGRDDDPLTLPQDPGGDHPGALPSPSCRHPMSSSMPASPGSPGGRS